MVPNWPKWQSLNPRNFTKNDHRWNIFSNLSSGQQWLLNDLKKFRQKWLVKKSKFVWRKKTHPEHKYSVTFVSKVGTIKPATTFLRYDPFFQVNFFLPVHYCSIDLSLTRLDRKIVWNAIVFPVMIHPKIVEKIRRPEKACKMRL